MVTETITTMVTMMVTTMITVMVTMMVTTVVTTMWPQLCTALGRPQGHAAKPRWQTQQQPRGSGPAVTLWFATR